MPRYRLRARKTVYFSTIVEGKNVTDVLLKVEDKPRIWVSENQSNISDESDLNIMGNPKELQ